ncbi:hypothetical protein FD755_012937 [Muntiacus reevesi]|uniref:C2H2-type domain-containing protein n=1 Tax=Muntiacus reevesi TaxID=9886 RepID=A0A5N3XQC0_MUNRE|nr:hypothetical protein FD755_012937 [Muntiacus reevesi]
MSSRLGADNSFQYTVPHDDSLTSFRKSTYWMKMRRIKSVAASHVEGSDGVSTKGKRKPRQDEDEAHQRISSEELNLNPKAQTCCIRKEPPWYLNIVDKGSVSCPTCQVVGKKTTDSLKKHMETANSKFLKKLGKLRCTHESCSSSSTSIMGYLYHVRKCGKRSAELEKMTLKCHHCGKPCRLKIELVYHLRSEHSPISFFPESGQPECLKEMTLGIAVYHLQELASAELAKEWPKRKVLQDLKSDIKKYNRIQCPNQGCEAVYSSVSGLKAHLGSCTLGRLVAEKYRYLLHQKEFVSESGDWFVVNPTAIESFEKLVKKIKQRQQEEEKQRRKPRSRWFLRQQQPGIKLPETEPSLRVGKDHSRSHEELLQEPVPTQFQKVKSPKMNHK